MRIQLPNKVGTKINPILEIQKSLVVIGANGAGKSKFGKAIADTYKEKSVFLSALHSLYHLKSKDSDTMMEINSNFDQLLEKLLMDEYASAMKFKELFRFDEKTKPEFTKMDKLQILWKQVMVNSDLVVRGKSLEVLPHKIGESIENIATYQPSKMSEGEKIVFYFICSVLFAHPASLIIVDEPEMHLHRSVISTLWNILEEERPDCTFIYLTNDIPFASSRNDSMALWVKGISVSENRWDYEIAKAVASFSQEVYLEILGSRKPMLFVEGNDTSSIDIRLYPHIFPEYNVKPLGGCSTVIDSTRTLNNLMIGNILQAIGIVDRDRRTEEEIEHLKTHKIYVPQVAEVENLLMLPDIIFVVAKRRGYDPKTAFEEIKKRLLEQFGKEVSEQAMLHVRHLVRRQLEANIDKRTTSITEYERYIRSLVDEIHPAQLYADLLNRFKILCRGEDYMGVLKVYNQKQMLQSSNLFKICGTDGLNGYISTIVNALHEGKEDARLIRSTFKKCLGME